MTTKTTTTKTTRHTSDRDPYLCGRGGDWGVRAKHKPTNIETRIIAKTSTSPEYMEVSCPHHSITYPMKDFVGMARIANQPVHHYAANYLMCAMGWSRGHVMVEIGTNNERGYVFTRKANR